MVNKEEDRMYAHPEVPQVAWSPAQDKPPTSWWLATAIGVPAFNVFAFYGIVAALSSLSLPILGGAPVLSQLWWVPAIGVLAFEYVGFRMWGDRRGLGRGWAVAGAGIAFALGVVFATVVLFIALADCDGCLS